MGIVREVVSVFSGNVFLTVMLCVGSALLLFAMVLGYVCNDAGIYVSVWVTIVCLAGVALLWSEAGIKKGITCLALLTSFGGVGHLLLFGILLFKKRLQERRERRAEATRRLSYALPDRDNSYVKARLQTALNAPEEAGAEKYNFTLAHARKLLAKIKESPLTAVERLETEEMSRLLALYVQKERWTADDLRIANELFARILKLSGKYAV